MTLQAWPYLRSAYAAGYAVFGAFPIPEHVESTMTKALRNGADLIETHPDILYIVEAEGIKQGLFATLFMRRDRITEVYKRKLRIWTTKLSRVLPNDELRKQVQNALQDYSNPDPTRKQQAAKQAAFVLITNVLAKHPELETELEQIVQDARDQAAAEGSTQAIALTQLTSVRKMPDLEETKRKQLDKVQKDPTRSSGTSGVMGAILAGLAGDVAGRKNQDDTEKTVALGVGAIFYLDHAISQRYATSSLDFFATQTQTLDFVTVGDDKVCAECLAAEAGSPFDLSSFPSPPLHAGCFPAGTPVTSPQVLGSTVRWYEGELVEIVTATGKLLSVTPNHPIATPQGFVAAGSFCEGDDVLSCVDAQRVVTLIDPDHYCKESLIEDIAETLGGCRGVVTRSVPVSPEDFHGDGELSEICIVRTDSQLWRHRHPEIEQIFSELLFDRASDKALSHLESSSFTALLNSGLPPEAYPVGTLGQSHAFFRACLSHSDEHRLRPISWLDSVLKQDSSDREPGNSIRVCQGLLTLSSDVTLDKIINIRRRPFSGHVYNLHTSTGWYIANGIVAHNCRCWAAPGGTMS